MSAAMVSADLSHPVPSWERSSEICIFLLVLAIHLRVEKRAIKEILHQIGAFLNPTLLVSRFTKSFSLDCKMERHAREVQQQYEEVRMQYSVVLASCGSHFLLLSLAVLLHYCTEDDACSFTQFASVLAGYILCVCVRHGWLKVTFSRVSLMCSVLYLIILMRTLAIQKTATYFTNANYRIILRFAVGLSHPSPAWAGFWNCLIAVASAYRHIQLSAGIDSLQGPPGFVIIGELLNGMSMTCMFCLVEKWIVERIRATIDARDSRHEHMAAKRLLSVLCDSEICLGPDLCMIGSVERLANLLMTSSHALQGKSFVSFLPDSDAQRFHNFIKEAVSSYSSEIKTDLLTSTGAPASLNVGIRLSV